MCGDHVPYEFCFALCYSADGNERRSMCVAANTHFCFTAALEHVNVWRPVIVRPNDELKAVDEKDGWHARIIPVRLGYWVAA